MRPSPDYTLYVITERTPGRSHLEVARAALQGGATVIQLREKELPPLTLVAEAREIARLCRERGVTFIVNDSVELAAACGADGVHLGPEDLPPAQARAVLGAQALVGGSAGTVAEAQALAGAADYLGVGTIYATATKPDAGHPIGPEGLAAIRRAVALPLVAIGGLHAGNVEAMIRAGADGVAVVSAVTRAPDMVEAAHRLRRLIEETRART